MGKINAWKAFQEADKALELKNKQDGVDIYMIRVAQNALQAAFAKIGFELEVTDSVADNMTSAALATSKAEFIKARATPCSNVEWNSTIVPHINNATYDAAEAIADQYIASELGGALAAHVDAIHG